MLSGPFSLDIDVAALFELVGTASMTRLYNQSWTVPTYSNRMSASYDPELSV